VSDLAAAVAPPYCWLWPGFKRNCRAPCKTVDWNRDTHCCGREVTHAWFQDLSRRQAVWCKRGRWTCRFRRRVASRLIHLHEMPVLAISWLLW